MGYTQVRPAPRRRAVVAHVGGFSQVHPNAGFSQVHPGHRGFTQVAHVPDRLDPFARAYAIARLSGQGVQVPTGQDPTAAWREYTQRNALLRYLASQQPQVGNLTQFDQAPVQAPPAAGNPLAAALNFSGFNPYAG